jgi:exopolysaccharide biosynthesis polyprenyl glycosylphosphotransferase
MFQLFGDVAATATSVPLAYWLRFQLDLVPITKGVPELERYLDLLPVVAVLWPTVFYFQGLYQLRRIRSRFDELWRLAMAILLATILLTAGLTFYRPPDFTYSRVFLTLFAAVNLGLVTTTRWSIAAVLARVRRSGGNLQNVLIIGAGELGRKVAERLVAHVEYGFRVVGFLDDDPGKQQRSLQGVPVLGATAELESVVEARQVDQVVIALPLSAHNKIAHLIRRAGQLLTDIKVVPDLLQYYAIKAGVEDLDGLPMINLTQIPLHGWNQIVKRAFDVAGAAALLLATSPLFPVVAWLVKRQDGGPVLYSQLRTGLDGRTFRLYKFRSMRVDADDGGQACWTRTRDERITRLGAFLRRSNLDELPQLFNVLRGDMSLVGPRPEQPEYVERFRDRYPEYNTRHRVRSGLTGWAQVNGLRGDTSIRQRVIHDLYYIENWSFALDLKILWRTLRVAFHGGS